jgi:hypothetical protein
VEPFGSFACLLVGSALTLGALWLVVRRGWRQLAVAATYQEVARQVGLWADTRGISVQGHLGDRRIWVGEVLLRHGPDRRTVTWGLVEFARPLGLGLAIGRRRRRWLGHSDAVSLADPILARRYRVTGDDPQAIGALLRPDVQAALGRLAEGWPRLVASDGQIRVDLPEPESTPQRLRALVDALLELAARLEQARADLPAPPGACEQVPAWVAAAGGLGLVCDTRYPALHGNFSGRRALAVVRRSDGGWATELTLWFKAHEETGLRIAPQRAPDGYWSVGQDIQLGDDAFDRAFVIKAWDPLWVSEAFDPDLRALLHALAAGAELEIDDRVLVIRRLPLDPTGFEARFALATQAADRLGW